jgi:hypothetical protein
VALDALSEQAAAFLWAMMQLRSRIAVSGEPGAGKTTLGAALLSAVPASHCGRSCEEIRELAVPLVHGAYYEVRPPGLDGTGEISLRDLVKFVLAMFRFSYISAAVDVVAVVVDAAPALWIEAGSESDGGALVSGYRCRRRCWPRATQGPRL